MSTERKLWLEPNEIRLFHKNYDYMWRKLNTTYYQVKDQSARICPVGINGKEYLPSYRICAQLKNDKKAIPSQYVLNAIVNFYNANLTPAVDSIQFVREDLSHTNDIRFRSSVIVNRKLIGNYYCYYYPASSDTKTAAAYMSIFEEYDTLHAYMISGYRDIRTLLAPDTVAVLHTDNSKKSSSAIFRQNCISYKAKVTENGLRCACFEGIVEATNHSLQIRFQQIGGNNRRMTAVFTLEGFPADKKRYDGGLGFVLSTSDGHFDTRINKMGIIRTDNGSFSLDDEHVHEALKIHSSEDGFQLILSTTIDRYWYELYMSALQEGKLIR